MKASFLLLASAATALAGLYDGTDVIQLSDSDFTKKVIKDSGIWLVEVYADWCGHCKAAKPEVVKAAQALKGFVNVGVVDGDKNRATASQLGVQGFPTFKLYLDNKNSPIDYNGARDAKAMVDFVMREVQSLANRRMGGKGSSSSSSSSGSRGSGNGGASEPGGGKHVVKVSGSRQWQTEVMDSNDPVLVEFYAPWCGHCKSLAAPLAAAAEELVGEVKIVALDATQDGSIANEYGVKGYPTLKFFPAGKKTADSAQDYNGGRDKEGIVTAVRNLVEATGGAHNPVNQLSSPQQWADECGAGKRICVVSFLPHILDDGAAKRNARIETLQAVAKKVGKRSLFRFLWSEVGAQADLEGALNVGMVPAVYAVSVEKKVVTPYRGAFDEKPLASFVNGLVVKNEGAVKLGAKGVPAIAKATAWDGKDGKLESGEEEMSLEELGL